MNVIGIVVEYNPFHNGHLYHLNKIKELYPDSIVIAIMSGNFNERGEVSIIPKWDKASIALSYGIDIVIELPYVFASQSADIFSYGAISIMKHMKVDTIVFGSESNDISSLIDMANIQINHNDYDDMVKSHMDKGLNYPTSMSLALENISGNKITPISIQRTNNYHDINLGDTISSATSIRRALKNNIDVSKFVPEITMSYLKDDLYFNELYFKMLKYKIITDDDISKYNTIDEGIENRIKNEIYNSISYEDLINRIKTKRYTYNRVSRMLMHILTGFTKEEARLFNKTRYIRILGFNKIGQNYLNKIKKEIELPLITNFSSHKDLMLDIEKRASSVYYSILDEKKSIIKMTEEYKHKPITRD